jgi:hypothetical protein
MAIVRHFILPSRIPSIQCYDHDACRWLGCDHKRAREKKPARCQIFWGAATRAIEVDWNWRGAVIETGAAAWMMLVIPGETADPELPGLWHHL